MNNEFIIIRKNNNRMKNLYGFIKIYKKKLTNIVTLPNILGIF